MSARYLCGDPGRVAAVRDEAGLNGIDYVEIASPDQRQIDLFFVHPLPGQSGGVPAAPPLGLGNFTISGGDRIRGIAVEQILATDGERIRLLVSEAGDFSSYALALVQDRDNPDPPAGFDPRLAQVDFSFKAACPSDYDCAAVTACPPASFVEPQIDYLAKDYAGFRRVMLDRLSVVMPGWGDASPADPYLALVESLAFAADRLSYRQDAAATEAYLGTARSRVSLRRHARLVDYRIGEGMNARTFVQFEVAAGSAADGGVLPAGTLLAGLQPGLGATLDAEQTRAALRSDAPRFATLADVALRAAHNRIAFYGWSDGQCCLPPGATAASLADDPPLALAPGDFLLLAQTAGPASGDPADADPALRHPVRLTKVRHVTDPIGAIPVCEIEWDAADALLFALPLEAEPVPGSSARVATAAARGNFVPADEGFWAPDAALAPDAPDEDEPYRPVLADAPIVWAAPAPAADTPARDVLAPDPRDAAPAIALNAEDQAWSAVPDLLSSDRFAHDFVAEAEFGGGVTLRFGDRLMGAAPTAGARFAVRYRIGGGVGGNVGADVLRHVANPPFAGIQAVTNPVPATGGRDPESAASIRRFAPAQVAVQRRAVTEADYARAAEQLPEVQRAAARIRWTGSWYTVFVIVDRVGGLPTLSDAPFSQRLLDQLDGLRMAGYDLQLVEPVFVALDLTLHVCVKPGYFRAHVKQALDTAFGRGGFFDPDRFSFGDALPASRVLAAAMAVDGVASASLTRFGPLGGLAVDPVVVGVLTPGPQEILRLDGDPDHPDRGRIRFDLTGGI